MSFKSEKRFDDIQNLPQCARKAIGDDFGYEHMSAAQAMYLQAVVNGQDLLVRAGTGTGKTLGFLLPLVTALMQEERSANSNSNSNKRRQSVAVVLSPARELAEQTLAQARKLADRCGLRVQGLIGGVRSSKADANAMATQGVDIIVATPGRLMDHLETTPGFSDMLRERGRVLVLDEVDRLLDPGFKPAMLRASAVMSHPRRQTLLFTATATAAVRAAGQQLMRGDDAFIDAGASNATGNAGAAHNANVTQEAVLLPPSLLVPHAIRALRSATGHSVVFAQTAAMAIFLTKIVREVMAPTPVFQIHSRMDQRLRSRAVREFSESTVPAVIIATDVFARGLDVRNVELVVQMGIAMDNAQVAHRAGRTGRGGATGRSLMVLADNEAAVLEDLIGREKMPIRVIANANSNANANAKKRSSNEVAAAEVAEVAEVLRKLSGDADFKRNACAAFIASIGFYKAQVKRLKWRADDLVPAVARLFEPLGVPAPSVCPVPAKTVRKMGLAPGHGLTVLTTASR